MIAPSWRTAAVVIASAGALVVLVLSVALHDRRATHLDNMLLARLAAHVSGVWRRVTLDMSIPAVSLVLLAVVLLLALYLRRLRLAVVIVMVPAIASGVTEYLLKPLVHRSYGSGRSVASLTSLSFPSGHETLVASAAMAVALAVPRLVRGPVQRTAALIVLAVWMVGAGVGLVVNFFHYSSDIVGAIALSAAVALGTALVVDRVAERFSSPAGRGRTRTAHAA